MIEYKNKKFWLENYKGVGAYQQNSWLPVRPSKPESSTNSVGWPVSTEVDRSVDRAQITWACECLFMSVDRLVDRAQVTWACARLVHVGRPVGRPSLASVDRSVDRQ